MLSIDTNRKKLGVIANKEIYSRGMQIRCSSFDNALGAYTKGDQIVARDRG